MWDVDSSLPEGRNRSLLHPQHPGPIRGRLWVSGEGAAKGTEAESATTDENLPDQQGGFTHTPLGPNNLQACRSPGRCGCPRALCSLLEPTPSPTEALCRQVTVSALGEALTCSATLQVFREAGLTEAHFLLAGPRVT